MAKEGSHNERRQKEKAPTRIKYHTGFVSGLELLLWPYRDKTVIEVEKWLSTEGLRMDVLLLKKDPDLTFDFAIGRIFKGHNILEYKRPDDTLDISVFAKVMAYAQLYKSLEISADAISYKDMSVTIYRHAYPRDAFRQLKAYGAEIRKEYSGVYYIAGMSPFSVQILVGRELSKQEYAMFHVLTPDASDEDIRKFKDMALQNNDAAYQKSVDNVFQVSIMANGASYRRLLKEDTEMCEAMRRLMEDDFIKAEEKGKEIGEIQGVIKVYNEEFHLSPYEIIRKIMIRFGLREEEAQQYVEETLQLEKA